MLSYFQENTNSHQRIHEPCATKHTARTAPGIRVTRAHTNTMRTRIHSARTRTHPPPHTHRLGHIHSSAFTLAMAAIPALVLLRLFGLVAASLAYASPPSPTISAETDAKAAASGSTFANPLNLPYRFQPSEPSRREAADPTMVVFNETYGVCIHTLSAAAVSPPGPSHFLYLPICQIAMELCPDHCRRPLPHH